MAATGCKQANKLVEYLQLNNIRYFESKKGPWTTTGLIDASKGLLSGHDLGAANDNEEAIL